MTLLRNRKKQQRRRNLLLAGAGIGGLGLATGGVALARRPQPVSTLSLPSASSAHSGVVASVELPTRGTSVKPRLSEVKPKVSATGGAIVHIPGLGKTYYPSSPLVERNVRLGKPGGRARSRQNRNEWDYYRDANKGAYNLRNTRRYDKGRFMAYDSHRAEFLRLSGFRPRIPVAPKPRISIARPKPKSLLAGKSLRGLPVKPRGLSNRSPGTLLNRTGATRTYSSLAELRKSKLGIVKKKRFGRFSAPLMGEFSPVRFG